MGIKNFIISINSVIFFTIKFMELETLGQRLGNMWREKQEGKEKSLSVIYVIRYQKEYSDVEKTFPFHGLPRHTSVSQGCLQ